MKTINSHNLKQQFIKAITASVLCLSLAGCEQFLEVELPASQLNTPFVFESYATANAAMVDIYAKMRDNGLLSGNSSGMGASLGAYADELQYFGNPTSSLHFFYANTLLPTTGTLEIWWNSSYNQIYAANAVYNGVGQSESLTPENKRQLQGEALLVRGWIHFHLANLFGEIPYIKTTDYLQNQAVSKIPTQEIYDLAIQDLENAKALLPENYFGGARVRPNKSVAAALLAKAYLYNQNWAAAANEASFLINQTGTYSFPQNTESTFLIQSPSTIWQLLPQAGGRNTLEGSTFIFLSGPPSSIALAPQLMDAFEEGDLRKANWTKEVANANGTWHHAFKYRQRTNTAASQEHSVLFRLAEIYLIRAEARARQGELTSAAEDVNTIRALAGLAPTAADTQESLLQAIAQERKVELFTEFGNRFFDLKRTDQLDSTLNGIKPAWNAYMKNIPIPQREVLLNPNLLPQNDGY